MIKAVFIDFEGVVTKNGRILHDNLAKLIEKRIGVEEMHERYSRARNGESSFEEFSKGIPKNFLQKYLGLVKYRRGSKQALEELNKKKLKLILASNHVPVLFESEMKKIGAEKYFDKIFASYKIRLAKPHKEYFEFILKKSKARASEAIFVDDAKRNLEVPKKLGMIAVWVNNKINDPRNENNIKPDYEINDLRELTKIIEKINRRH